MGEVHRLPGRRHEYIEDTYGSAMRATWHTESGLVVISLWRGDVCAGTAHLRPKEAARLAGFITSGLSDLATMSRQSGGGGRTSSLLQRLETDLRLAWQRLRRKLPSRPIR